MCRHNQTETDRAASAGEICANSTAETESSLNADPKERERDGA